MNQKKKIPLSDIQPLEFDILARLLDYFEENGIAYFTSGGTTLGSVRHGGFIPWDDDIDLYVPRADYNRLLSITDGALIGGYIRIRKPGDKNYIYPFAKACNEKTRIQEQNVRHDKYAIGIFVDIFPLDAFYENRLKNIALLLKIKYYKSMLETASDQINLSPKGSLRRLLKESLRFIQKPIAKKSSVERLAKKIDAMAAQTACTAPRYVGDLVWCNGWADYYDAAYFAKPVRGVFEGRPINNPCGWDAYLRRLYGDYMQLPPKEQQVMHGFEAWYTEDFAHEL